jgi:hypothetical protein
LSPWDRLARAAETRAASGRRALVPILGSGFVREAVARGTEKRPTRRGPQPLDWLSLLRGVAEDFSLGRAISHIERDVPGQTTLLWDSMLAELASQRTRDGRSRPAHAWEDELRQAVAERLLDDRATVRAARPLVKSLLKLGFEDLMTFNFDSVLLPDGTSPKPLAKRPAAHRASLGARFAGTTVWFPHGHAVDPKSIVLGARAYGARILAMQAAFDDHARQTPPRPASGLGSWVAVALERPLLFAGLSLTREEWTIWWLLAQRTRYLARRPPEARPPAFVIARRPEPIANAEQHAAFATLSRAAELLGVELLETPDHRTGWRRLSKALDW